MAGAMRFDGSWAWGTVPAPAPFFGAGGFRREPHVRRRGGTVGLAEGVAAGDQRDRLFVIHRHAGEGFADIPGSRDRIRLPLRAFWIHVDQAHLHGSERIFEIALTGISLVSTQPGLLGAPVDILV